MLAKELRETFKQAVFTLQFILILTVILLFMLKIPFFDIFFPVFQFGLLFFALLMGNFIFSLDREQRGLEYLLSLPFTRIQLLGYKFFPRLGAVALFYLIHLLIYFKGGENAAVVPLFYFSLLYTALFLIAFSFSTVSENFVISSAVSVLFMFIYTSLLILAFSAAFFLKGFPIYYIEYFSKSYLIWLIALVLLVPFTAAFIRAFKRFDIRPVRIYNQKFFKLFLPFILTGFILSVVIACLGIHIDPYREYCLTQGNILIENQSRHLNIYYGDKVNSIDTSFRLFPLIEKENFIISGGADYRNNQNKYVLYKLDPGTAQIKIIYETHYKNFIGFPEFWTFENEVIFFEKGKNPKEYKIIFLNLSDGKTTLLKIEPPPGLFHSLKLFGTEKIEGRRFWLVAQRQKQKQTILQVWEDGRITNLGISHSFKLPLYVNRLLLSYTTKNIYTLKNGRMDFLIEFPYRISYKLNKSSDSVYFFKTGIVTRIKGKTRVFALPDLQEIKLKGLSP